MKVLKTVHWTIPVTLQSLTLCSSPIFTNEEYEEGKKYNSCIGLTGDQVLPYSLYYLVWNRVRPLPREGRLGSVLVDLMSVEDLRTRSLFTNNEIW